MNDERRTVGKSFYVDVFENAPDMICSVDVESAEITACNRTYAEKLGLTKDEVIGRAEVELFHPDTREAVREALERLREEGTVENVEAQMVHADGTVFDVSLSATAVEEDGEVVATRSVLRDISELKDTERKLRERTQRLRKANEELEQFAYLASHDLQEPLRMVASYTQLLAKRYGGELDERADKYINYAVEGAERMKRLLNDLLEYSRLGRTGDGFERVQMRRIVEDVRANLKILIGEHGGEVVVDGELPEVWGEPTQLLQLFQNLVENGLKFHDDQPPRVEISAETRRDRVVVRVSDNGIGFEPENAERIFQIFQRLHERGAYEGTGTGLAIVKKVVEHHDGSIEVTSEPGEGASFEFDLPAV